MARLVRALFKTIGEQSTMVTRLEGVMKKQS
eukprot:COSAG05_NODE_3329_length_2146_cov_53.444098_3_plen_30_part_01